MLPNVGSEAKKRATYQDVLDAPDNVVAEVIDGELYTQPRPRYGHGIAALRLGGLLDAAVGGTGPTPQTWVFLPEPELHLGPEPDIVVPDLAGWRAERYPGEPDTPFSDVAPDWVCEVLSPSTARKDRALKLPLYAREGVRHAWLVDPQTQVLEVYALDDRGWRLVGTHAGDAVVSPAPFESSEISLARIWEAAQT